MTKAHCCEVITDTRTIIAEGQDLVIIVINPWSIAQVHWSVRQICYYSGSFLFVIKHTSIYIFDSTHCLLRTLEIDNPFA